MIWELSCRGIPHVHPPASKRKISELFGVPSTYRKLALEVLSSVAFVYAVGCRAEAGHGPRYHVDACSVDYRCFNITAKARRSGLGLIAVLHYLSLIVEYCLP